MLGLTSSPWWSCNRLKSLAMYRERVAYPWSWDLVWSAPVGGTFLFWSMPFQTSVGSSVVDVCTKAMVGGMCRPNSAPPMVKSTMVNQLAEFVLCGRRPLAHLFRHLLYYLGSTKEYCTLYILRLRCHLGLILPAYTWTSDILRWRSRDA
ncbi:hypothetical protein BHE74_00028966 [Ensete ventricosum]|nr:hypothetical protein BHE74_00028966 [Ensete ventricosum]